MTDAYYRAENWLYFTCRPYRRYRSWRSTFWLSDYTEFYAEARAHGEKRRESVRAAAVQSRLARSLR